MSTTVIELTPAEMAARRALLVSLVAKLENVRDAIVPLADDIVKIGTQSPELGLLLIAGVGQANKILSSIYQGAKASLKANQMDEEPVSVQVPAGYVN